MSVFKSSSSMHGVALGLAGLLGALLIGCSGLVIVSIEWKDSIRTKRAPLG